MDQSLYPILLFQILKYKYIYVVKTAKCRLGYIFPEIFFGGIGFSWSSTVHLVEIFYYPETITSKTLNSCQNLIASNLQNLVSENFRPGVKLMTNCIRFCQRKSKKKYIISKTYRLTPRMTQRNKAQAVARPVSGRFNFRNFLHL